MRVLVEFRLPPGQKVDQLIIFRSDRVTLIVVELEPIGHSALPQDINVETIRNNVGTLLQCIKIATNS